MRHERILTQKSYLDILNKFHHLSKDKSKYGIDELVIEIEDKEILSKINVPQFIEELSKELHVSLEDMISIVLKCFSLDWKHGRSELKNIIEKLDKNKKENPNE